LVDPVKRQWGGGNNRCEWLLSFATSNFKRNAHHY